MDKPFWEENFEWFEQEPLSKQQIQELPIEEQVQRELKLAKMLFCF